MSDRQRHHRRPIRLKGYDYAQAGAYFVTIVTHDRACLFGDVVEGKMRLNEAGQIARQCWVEIPRHFPHVELDEFVVMPNHVHGILVIVDNVGARHAVPLLPTTRVRTIRQTRSRFHSHHCPIFQIRHDQTHQ